LKEAKQYVEWRKEKELGREREGKEKGG